MSEFATLARPYAEAAFKTAKGSNSSAQWSDMLAFISAVVKDKAITSAADNPKISKDKLAQLMLEICGEHLSKEGVNFLRLLVVNGRLRLTPFIAELFETYRSEDEGYVEADVTTAFAINQQEEKNLAMVLQKKLGKQIHLHVDVDQSLIGGIFVRAGDTVIDGSIKGQLQQLAKRL